MNKQRDPNTDFEARLLAQLQAVVAERDADAADVETQGAPPSWRRPGPRLALGGGVALAAVAAALVVSAGGDNTPAAYAVETQEGGGVKIEIYSLGDPEGVEAALEDAGVPSQVTYLEPGMTCREPHFQPSSVEMPNLPGGEVRTFTGINLGHIPPTGTDPSITIGIGTAQQQRELFDQRAEELQQGEQPATDTPSFVVDPTSFRPDQTLIVSGAPIGPGSPMADAFNAPGAGQAGTEMKVRVAEGDVEPCEPVPLTNG